MKGAVQSWVVGLIIVLAVVLALWAFQGRILTSRDKLLEQKECRESVKTNAKARLLGYEFSSKINCPTGYETVSGNDEAVKQGIAYNLYACWDKFGKGQLELFKPSDATFCSICSYLTFDDKKTVTGLLDYLSTHNVPLEAGQHSYFEFLQGRKYTNNIPETLASTGIPDAVDTGKPFGVVFVYGKDAKTTKAETAGIGAMIGYGAGLTVLVLSGGTLTPVLVGAAAGGVAGGGIGYWLGSDNSADWDARILAVPMEEAALQKLGCTYLPIKTIKQNTA